MRENNRNRIYIVIWCVTPRSKPKWAPKQSKGKIQGPLVILITTEKETEEGERGQNFCFSDWREGKREKGKKEKRKTNSTLFLSPFHNFPLRERSLCRSARGVRVSLMRPGEILANSGRREGKKAFWEGSHESGGGGGGRRPLSIQLLEKAGGTCWEREG